MFTPTIGLLTFCQALMTIANSLMVATSALVGLQLTGQAWAATIPAGILHIANTLTTMPASLLMARIGRRKGFWLASILGMIGAGLAMWSIISGSFIWFCVAVGFIGAFNGFGAYFRFTAAEVVSPDRKARALSFVLAGGVLAAFVGPWLATVSQDWYLGANFAGSYGALIGIYLLVFVSVVGMSVPPVSIEEKSQKGRALPVIMRQPSFILAAMAAAVGYANMALLMNATPLAMQHASHTFSSTAMVIQWHIFAMFAPSFVTGHIIDRIGVIRVITLGAVLGLGCIVLALLGQGFWHYWVALVVLGLSWNFMFVGGSTLMTDTYQPEEKARAQGANDFFVFGLVAIGALMAGPLLDWLGWRGLNLLAIFPYAAVLFTALWHRFASHSG